jgi:hypothetical protein
MIVSLTQMEVAVATMVGSYRNAESNFSGRKPRFPEKTSGELWGFHIESALAELAVSKALGIYWGFSVNTFHVPDIANTNIEVRWSTSPRLKIRPDDPDARIMVSVRGSCHEKEIMGWCYAREGKLKDNRSGSEPPCYFHDHEDLSPINSLTPDIYLLTPKSD